MKITSRKFIVWLIWAIFAIGSVIVTKTINPEMISWFGAISMIYIGGNVAQKFLFKNKPDGTS